MSTIGSIGNTVPTPSTPPSVKGLGVELAAAVMATKCVLLSHDPALRHQLSTLLIQEFGCNIQEMGWQDDSSAIVGPDSTLFLELTSNAISW